MFRKSCPFLHSESLYKNGQGFLDNQYAISGQVPSVVARGECRDTKQSRTGTCQIHCHRVGTICPC